MAENDSLGRENDAIDAPTVSGRAEVLEDRMGHSVEDEKRKHDS